MKSTQSKPFQVPKRSSVDYLVVIDLEATCDEGENGNPPLVTQENQEIIELPWVIVDLAANKQIHEEQLFVRPVWSKTLTKFCTNLTGIKNEQVADAPILEDALKSLQGCLSNHLRPGCTYCLCADGSWDLEVALRGEALKKKIDTVLGNPLYSQYFDLRVEFQQCYPEKKVSRPSLKKMFSELDMEMKGRAHSGISDARNVAALAQRMLTDGHAFITPKGIANDYDPRKDTKLKDFNLSRTFSREPVASFLASTSPAEETCIVKIRGLPWEATNEDIRKFFHPYQLTTAASRPLSVNQSTLSVSSISSVSMSSSSSSSANVNHTSSDSPEVNEMNKGKDDEEKVKHTIEKAPVLLGIGAAIVLNQLGKASGFGFAEFESVASAKAAIKEKNRQTMRLTAPKQGRVIERYLELYPSDVNEYKRAMGLPL